MKEDMELVTQTQRLPSYKMAKTPKQKSETLLEDAPLSRLDLPGFDTSLPEAKISDVDTLQVPVIDTPLPKSGMMVVHTPPPASPPDTTYPIKATRKQSADVRSRLRDAANAQMVQERCRQLSLSLFFREQSPVRSLGFTSSVCGEGKSFLSMVTADVLAKDSSKPVTLLECDWENPYFHKHFGLSSAAGLAEWLREECSEMDIRHNVDHNLTVIPAGNGREEAVKLLQLARRKGLMNMLACKNELLVVDLPSIVAPAYGSLAASLVESLIIVVRAGVTPDVMIAETCSQLKDLPVHGLLLNQVESSIPRWLRQIL